KGKGEWAIGGGEETVVAAQVARRRPLHPTRNQRVRRFSPGGRRGEGGNRERAIGASQRAKKTGGTARMLGRPEGERECWDASGWTRGRFEVHRGAHPCVPRCGESGAWIRRASMRSRRASWRASPGGWGAW